VLAEVVRVEVRELERVPDHLDLGVQAPDVGVADIRHRLEEQVVDLAPGQPLQHVARAAVVEEGVAGFQREGGERPRQLGHPLFIGPEVDERAAPLERPLEVDDFALHLEGLRLDDVERLVQDELLARLERGGVEARVAVDLELAPPGRRGRGPGGS